MRKELIESFLNEICDTSKYAGEIFDIIPSDLLERFVGYCKEHEEEGSMRLHCNDCGKSVSTEVPKGTVFRARATCPECTEKLMCDERQALGLTDEWRRSWGVEAHRYDIASAHTAAIRFVTWLYKQKNITMVKPQ